MAPSAAPVIFLMGPTAAGKTDLAVALVERLPLEIVSVDSALVYRGMDIGTAKPDAATLARAPHHLIDIVEPVDAYSAGQFRKDAEAVIAAIHARGRVPLLTGGTMLYFRALATGIAPLPPADAEVRRRLDEEMQAHGLAALHAELARVDPESARRIHPNDPQRIQRALEVWRVSGQPISRWQVPTAPLPNPILRLAVTPAQREGLHRRIEARFGAMLSAGLVDEVRALRERHDLHADLPSMRAVGYRQAWQHLEGEFDRVELERRGVVATRQLARRQLTWLRGMDDVEWFDRETVTTDRLADRINEFIDRPQAR